jgi:phytoene dehydrogenase-like protein
LPIGGSQQITNALENIFLENGGLIELNQEIQSLSELPTARAIPDLTPRQIVRMLEMN